MLRRLVRKRHDAAMPRDAERGRTDEHNKLYQRPRNSNDVVLTTDEDDAGGRKLIWGANAFHHDKSNKAAGDDGCNDNDPILNSIIVQIVSPEQGKPRKQLDREASEIYTTATTTDTSDIPSEYHNRQQLVHPLPLTKRRLDTCVEVVTNNFMCSKSYAGDACTLDTDDNCDNSKRTDQSSAYFSSSLIGSQDHYYQPTPPKKRSGGAQSNTSAWEKRISKTAQQRQQHDYEGRSATYTTPVSSPTVSVKAKSIKNSKNSEIDGVLLTPNRNMFNSTTAFDSSMDDIPTATMMSAPTVVTPPPIKQLLQQDISLHLQREQKSHPHQHHPRLRPESPITNVSTARTEKLANTSQMIARLLTSHQKKKSLSEELRQDEPIGQTEVTNDLQQRNLTQPQLLDRSSKSNRHDPEQRAPVSDELNPKRTEKRKGGEPPEDLTGWQQKQGRRPDPPAECGRYHSTIVNSYSAKLSRLEPPSSNVQPVSTHLAKNYVLSSQEYQHRSSSFFSSGFFTVQTANSAWSNVWDEVEESPNPDGNRTINKIIDAAATNTPINEQDWTKEIFGDSFVNGASNDQQFTASDQPNLSQKHLNASDKKSVYDDDSFSNAFSLNLPVNDFHESDISLLQMDDSATVYFLQRELEERTHRAGTSDFWKEKIKRIEEDVEDWKKNLNRIEEDVEAEEEQQQQQQQQQQRQNQQSYAEVQGVLQQLERQINVKQIDHTNKMVDNRVTTLLSTNFDPTENTEFQAERRRRCSSPIDTLSRIFHTVKLDNRATLQPLKKDLDHENFTHSNAINEKMIIAEKIERKDRKPMQNSTRSKDIQTPLPLGDTPELLLDANEGNDVALLTQWNQSRSARNTKSFADDLSSKIDLSTTDGSDLSENTKMIFEKALSPSRRSKGVFDESMNQAISISAPTMRESCTHHFVSQPFMTPTEQNQPAKSRLRNTPHTSTDQLIQQSDWGNLGIDKSTNITESGPDLGQIEQITYPIICLGNLRVKATISQRIYQSFEGCSDSIALQKFDSLRELSLLCKRPSKHKSVSQKIYNYGLQTMIKREAQSELNRNLLRYGPRHPEVGKCHRNLGLFLLFTENYNDAVTHLDDSIRIFTNTIGVKYPVVASTLMLKGLAQFGLERFEDSFASMQRVRSLRQEILGYKHPEMGQILNNLACVQYEVGDYKRAGSLFQEALDLQRAVFTTDSPFLNVVSKVLCNSAFLHAKSGSFPKALIEFEGALKIRHDLLFEDNTNDDIIRNMAHILAIQKLQHGAVDLEEITNEYMTMLRTSTIH